MSALPSPVLVPAGHVVRVRIGGQVYQSPVQPAATALALGNDLANRLTLIRDGASFVDFVDEHDRTVRIRARAITAVEVGPPPPRHDRPRTWDGDVHVHLGADPVAAVKPTFGWNVGDPDPTNGTDVWCAADDPSQMYGCTWPPGHGGPHVAGDGSEVCAVWENTASGANS